MRAHPFRPPILWHGRLDMMHDASTLLPYTASLHIVFINRFDNLNLDVMNFTLCKQLYAFLVRNLTPACDNRHPEA